MFTHFNCLFFLKNDKRHSDESLPIYLRITIDGKRSELSINKKVPRCNWIPKTGRVNSNDKTSRELNSYLNLLESKVSEAFYIMVQRNETITAVALKNKITGADEQPKMLIPIFQKHNRQMAALIPNGYSAGTLKRYNTSLSHTIEFLRWQYYCDDIDIKAIDHEFITNYDFFFRSQRHCAHNTTVKYLRNFRKIIHICVDNGWINKDPFLMYEARIKKVDRVFLTEEELFTIIQKDYGIKRLNLVKNIFVFSCLTGLAYSDVKRLKPDNIITGIDNKKWLSIDRTKTHTIVNVPLLPTALSILNKYQKSYAIQDQTPIFPILSNQKMNAYLKEIADMCRINKKITFHVGRHTFATTVTLNNNVPIESISKMLGHKNITTTQHYAKMLDFKVSQDMSLLYSKF